MDDKHKKQVAREKFRKTRKIKAVCGKANEKVKV